MQNFNDERDKVPIDELIKNGKPVDMDWFYLENRIRTFIHDLVTPYAKRTIDTRDQIIDIRDSVQQDRKQLEELRVQVSRLKRYDEYFADCNKKATSTDQLLKTIEKKFKDELNSMVNQKTLLKEKMAQIEGELSTFKGLVMDRNQDIKDIYVEISKIKDSVHTDILKMNKEIQEEVIIQNERLHELGEKLYSTVSYNTQKFKEFQKIDVRITTLEHTINSAKDQRQEMLTRLNEFKTWQAQTDRHLTKILPLQFSQVLFDALYINFKSKLRPKLRENFTKLFQGLELNVKGEASQSILGDLNFKKGEYCIPQQINMAGMNGATMASRLNASLSSEGMREVLENAISPKNGKKSIAQISGKNESMGKLGKKRPSNRGGGVKKEEIIAPSNPDQKIFVLHHRRKNPYKGQSLLSALDGDKLGGATPAQSRQKLSSRQLKPQESPYRDLKEEANQKLIDGAVRSRKPNGSLAVMSKKSSVDTQNRANRSQKSSNNQVRQLASNATLKGSDVGIAPRINHNSVGDSSSKDGSSSIIKGRGQVIGELSHQNISNLKGGGQVHKKESNKGSLIRNLLSNEPSNGSKTSQNFTQHANASQIQHLGANNDYGDATPISQNRRKVSGVQKGKKKNTEQSYLDRSNRDLTDRSSDIIGKTVIIINNPDELRQKVEEAVNKHLESENQRSLKKTIDKLSRGSSIIKPSDDLFNSEKQRIGILRQDTSQISNFDMMSHNNGGGVSNKIKDPIMEVRQSQEVSSPQKPKTYQERKNHPDFRLSGLNDLTGNHKLSTPMSEGIDQPLQSFHSGNPPKSNRSLLMTKKTSIVDQLVNKIQEQFYGENGDQSKKSKQNRKHATNEKAKKIITVPVLSDQEKQSETTKRNARKSVLVGGNTPGLRIGAVGLGQNFGGAVALRSGTGVSETPDQRQVVLNNKSFKTFDQEGTGNSGQNQLISANEDDPHIQIGQQELEAGFELIGQAEYYQEEEGEDDYYDEEEDGGEFILEEVDKKNKKHVKEAKRVLREEKEGINEEEGEREDDEISQYGSEAESSLDDRGSDLSGESDISQELFKMQQEVESLREELKSSSKVLGMRISEGLNDLDKKMKQDLKLFKDQMYDTKLQLMDETSRLKRERSDFQLEIKKLKDFVNSYAHQIDNHSSSLQRFILWSHQVGDILQLGSIIEAQEERDKQSIALIGLKESIHPPSEQQNYHSNLKKAKDNQIVSLENKCITCNNNASDRAILYSQFKMACLQYKPSNVQFQSKEYTKDEILNYKAKMILELQQFEVQRDQRGDRLQSVGIETDDKNSMFIHIQRSSPRGSPPGNIGSARYSQQDRDDQDRERDLIERSFQSSTFGPSQNRSTSQHNNRRNLINKANFQPLTQPQSPNTNYHNSLPSHTTTNAGYLKMRQKNQLENSLKVKFKDSSTSTSQRQSNNKSHFNQGMNYGNNDEQTENQSTVNNFIQTAVIIGVPAAGMMGNTGFTQFQNPKQNNQSGLSNSLNLGDPNVAQYRARKMNSTRPYSVAEPLRGEAAFNRERQGHDTNMNVASFGISTGMGNMLSGSGRQNILSLDEDLSTLGAVNNYGGMKTQKVRGDLSRGHTSLGTSQNIRIGQNAYGAFGEGFNRSTAPTYVKKINQDNSMNENSLHNHSVLTATHPSLDISQNTIPTLPQASKYVGYHKQKEKFNAVSNLSSGNNHKNQQ